MEPPRLNIEERVTSGGIAVRLVRADDGVDDKPWAVFCTGLTLPRDVWNDWHAELAPGYHLALFDVPGYGDSPVDPAALETREVADWTDFYLEVMDELGAETVYVVAEQTGGAAALYGLLRFPERVEACVLISTPFRGTAIRATISGYSAASQNGGIEAWSDNMLPRLFQGDEDSDLKDAFRAIHLANDLDVILHDGGSWSNVDLEADLPRIATPILIVAPGQSPIIAREHSFEFERLLPNATLVLFGGSGQLVAFTEAETVATMTRRFFNSHRANGR